MARGGYTSTSDMTYDRTIKPAYEALAATPSCPLRVSMWEMSTSEGFTEPESFAAGEPMLVKRGVKLWTDGSPWIGNIAISFPYLSNETTKTAGIDPAVAGGARSMNYTREQLDATLDQAAPAGWQMSFHANGDLAIELALDAYEAALQRHDLIGTDHRWRLEHLGAGTRAQFERAARLGVYVSMAPFQYYYWGDLLDGQLFDHEHGSRWQAFGDAVASGAVVSLHNDGSVSPPTPVLNIQTAVSRRTRAGNVHGADQAISLDHALRAHTIDAARTLHRDKLVGSIEVGKLADFTELTADPYTVDPAQLADTARVSGTWLSGKPNRPRRVRRCHQGSRRRPARPPGRSHSAVLLLNRRGNRTRDRIQMAFPPLTHVALTVRDLAVSVPWYRALIGADPVLDEDTEPGFHHSVFLLDNGTLLGLHQHVKAPSAQEFSEHNVGLDHVAFGCADRSRTAAVGGPARRARHQPRRNRGSALRFGAELPRPRRHHPGVLRPPWLHQCGLHQGHVVVAPQRQVPVDVLAGGPGVHHGRVEPRGLQ